MKSRNWQIGLFAITLAAGGAGVLSELQAAGDDAADLQTGDFTDAPPQTVSRYITAASPDWSTMAELGENGDGTAYTTLFVPIGEHYFSGSFGIEPDTYGISVNFQPGQSGYGPGSGSGQFSREAWVYDTNTWELYGIFMATVELSVANADSVGSYVRLGVTTAQGDPFTIVRENVRGNQAIGYACGSLSVWVDLNENGHDPEDLVAESTGGFGLVQANTTHTLQRIH